MAEQLLLFTIRASTGSSLAATSEHSSDSGGSDRLIAMLVQWFPTWRMQEFLVPVSLEMDQVTEVRLQPEVYESTEDPWHYLL